MIKRHALYWLIYVIFLIVGLLLLVFTEKGDTLLYFQSEQSSIIYNFFRVMSFIVEVPVFFVLAAVFLFYNYRASILIGAAGLGSLLIVLGLKLLFAMPRPMLYFANLGIDDAIQFLDNYTPLNGYTSFPSGHTTAAFVIFTSLAYIANRKWIDVLCVVLAILSGLSRIYLGNHFLEDVLAGSGLGIIVTLLCIKILDKLRIPDRVAFISLTKKSYVT